MILNHALRLNFNSRFGRSTVRDGARNPARELAAVRPCNDNQRASSTASFGRTRRPILSCRWRTAPGGALECVWYTATPSASAGEEPQICRLDELLQRANGITPYPQLSTWPENYTVPSIEPSALTVYARPSSIRIVRAGLFDGKKESGATLAWSLVRSCPQLSAASHSSQRATGLCRAKSGKAENGDDPRASRPA